MDGLEIFLNIHIFVDEFLHFNNY